MRKGILIWVMTVLFLSGTGRAQDRDKTGTRGLENDPSPQKILKTKGPWGLSDRRRRGRESFGPKTATPSRYSISVANAFAGMDFRFDLADPYLVPLGGSWR
jgi:hypothetical protein